MEKVLEYSEQCPYEVSSPEDVMGLIVQLLNDGKVVRGKFESSEPIYRICFPGNLAIYFRISGEIGKVVEVWYKGELDDSGKFVVKSVGVQLQVDGKEKYFNINPYDVKEG